MTARPDVSVVVASLNTRDYLAPCLAAIPAAAGPRAVEVVVVDSGSTDGSQAMVAERFPSVRLIQNPRDLGFGAANNVGARVAGGRSLLLLNSDCDMMPGALDVLAGALGREADLGVVFPRLLNTDGSLQPSVHAALPSVWRVAADVLGTSALRYRLYRTPALHRWLLRGTIARHAAASDVAWGGAACMVIRREAWERVGGFDEEFFLYWEDTDLCKRIGEAGYRLRYLPDASAVHHWAKATSQMRPATLLRESYRSRLRYFDKHVSRSGARLVRLTTLAELRVRWGLFAVVGALFARARDRSRAQVAASRVCLEALTRR